MKKNSKVYFIAETPFKEALQKEAKEKNITLAEFCRNKLNEKSKFDIIYNLLLEIRDKLK